MQRRKIFLAAAIVLAAVVSCKKNQEPEDALSLPGEVLSENDLQGMWTIVEETCTETLTFFPGTYLKTKARKGLEITEKEYGTYEVEDGVISWRPDKIESRERKSEVEYYDWYTVILDPAQIATRTAYMRGMYNKAALVFTEFVSPYSKYQENAQRRNDAFVMIYYKDGASIPSDPSFIEGRWEWMAHYSYQEDTLWESIELKDNTFELIKYNYGDRFTGTYTYENGYITLQIKEWYTGGLSYDLNEYQWRPTDKMWTALQNGDCFQKPFLPVNDTTCYSRIQNFNCIFVRR